MDLKDLKAQAYDRIIQIDLLQRDLSRLNQEIAKLITRDSKTGGNNDSNNLK